MLFEQFGLPRLFPLFQAEGLGGGESAEELPFDPTSAFAENMGVEDEEERDSPEADAEGASEGDAETPEDSKEEDPDDAEVELKVGEQTTKAKLRELKEAFTKRADADKLHTETSALRAKVDQDNARVTTGLTRLMKQAEEAWAPYAKIDWLAVSKDPSVDQEQFQALRVEAQKALDTYKTISQDLDTHVKAERDAATAQLHARAEATFKELSDPKTGIPEWGPQKYQELLNYAVSKGAPRETAQMMTDSWAFRMIHQAMLYEKGAQSAAEKVAKVVNKPARVLKPGASSGAGSTAADLKTAMKNLKASGSLDAAAAAFEASFGDA